MSKRQRRVVAIEEGDHSARPNDATRFLNHGQWRGNMAEQRVRHHDVEAAIRKVESRSVTNPKVDPGGEFFRLRPPSGFVDQPRAVIDSNHLPSEFGAALERSDFDARAAAEGQNVAGFSEWKLVEIGLAHGDEASIGGPVLQAGGDPFDGRIVEVINDVEDVAWHRGSY
jgi:hypothetical protein